MGKPVKDFKSFRKGDIVTLSDIQTQKEFGELSSDFRIIEVRTYREPSDFFLYTGYVCEYQGTDEDKDPQQIMVLLRQMNDDYDLFVYYMDQDGDVADFKYLIHEIELENEEDEEDDEEDDDIVVETYQNGFEMSVTLDMGDEDEDNEEDEEDPDTTEDLVERWDVTLNFDDADPVQVTWDKKSAGSTFGVLFSSTESEDDEKTLAEYITNDETHGNPNALIEWTGDSENGWIEIWYGCEITPEDIEMFRTKK